MANPIKSIILPKTLIKRKEGVVILPLEVYERIKEDLEMLQSKKLPKEIARARREVKKEKIISLDEVERKLNL